MLVLKSRAQFRLPPADSTTGLVVGLSLRPEPDVLLNRRMSARIFSRLDPDEREGNADEYAESDCHRWIFPWFEYNALVLDELVVFLRPKSGDTDS